MASRGHISCRQVRPGSVRQCRGSRTDGRRTARRLRELSLRWDTRRIPAYQPQAPYPVQTQYVTERAVAAPVRRVSTQRVASEVKPRRTWQKSALLIGGSAGAGAGVGALVGGKKGALAGAAIGGGAAAIYDQVKRH